MQNLNVIDWSKRCKSVPDIREQNNQTKKTKNETTAKLSSSLSPEGGIPTDASGNVGVGNERITQIPQYIARPHRDAAAAAAGRRDQGWCCGRNHYGSGRVLSYTSNHVAATIDIVGADHNRRSFGLWFACIVGTEHISRVSMSTRD